MAVGGVVHLAFHFRPDVISLMLRLLSASGISFFQIAVFILVNNTIVQILIKGHQKCLIAVDFLLLMLQSLL